MLISASGINVLTILRIIHEIAATKTLFQKFFSIILSLLYNYNNLFFGFKLLSY